MKNKRFLTPEQKTGFAPPPHKQPVTTNEQKIGELRGQVTEFKVSSNEQQIQKTKGKKNNPALLSTAMAITKAGGTLKSGSVRAFLSQLMGTAEVIAEWIEEFIEGKQKKGNQQGNNIKKTLQQ
jgi:hypothetical protein